MLFLEFLIIYFICIDTPIYDQPFSYQGTVLVIPLLHFYLFPPYAQQERRDELPPAPFYPRWSEAAPCYLLNAFIPPLFALRRMPGQCSYPIFWPPSSSLGVAGLLARCSQMREEKLTPEHTVLGCYQCSGTLPQTHSALGFHFGIVFVSPTP